MREPRRFRFAIVAIIATGGGLGCGEMDLDDGAEIEVPEAPLVNGAGALASLNDLIRRGADLFFNGTFNGNGRTCGTCHRADNNLTIDPAFIAKLPANDPLFVAEFVPALRQNFERPALMRKLGLILENVDGADNLPSKFVMRSVPHTLGLPLSLRNPPGASAPPNQRTGWGGDGAPGSGTLREFATGAVNQHFPKTLARRAGSDFRLPTDAELDAMEAFQLFTGRDAELDLTRLSLKPPIASAGQAVFISAPARCNGCHFNAGANQNPAFGGGNADFDTGVEFFPDPAAAIDPFGASRPDQGLGRGPTPDVPGGFGTGAFNTPPLVEAADTGPFFHNNIVNTIEEAVNFYNSAAFNDSPTGSVFGRISLTATQVNQVGAFLRVINALENIRSTTEMLRFIRANQSVGQAKQNQDLFVITLADITDGLEVMRAPGGIISGGANTDLTTARQETAHAKAQPQGSWQQAAIDRALAALERARRGLQN